MDSQITKEAMSIYERLDGVPKYTRRRNRHALHDMLERTGKMQSRYGPEFYTSWYMLEDEDGNLMKEAHFFHLKDFGCDEKLHERAKSRGIAINENIPRCKLCEAYARGAANGPGIKMVADTESG